MLYRTLCPLLKEEASLTEYGTMEYWAKAPLRRDQILLFSPTLDDSIGEDHPVRLLDEILRVQDWSAWEAEYDGTRGQPPIPPWIVAGVILYGLMRGIRSSRMLEYLCTHNIDFLWLVEGRSLDHTTICKFRTRFRKPLKDLFRQIGKLAMRMGLVRLVEVAFDGTRVKANASRCQTWTAERLEAALKELDALFEQAMNATEQADAIDQGVSGELRSKAPLPAELATAKARQAKLTELLAELREADDARRKAGINPERSPAQMPKADTDSQVMPNKEGGYAPNYTPLAATDVQGDWIVDCEVIAAPNEQNETLPTVDRIEEAFGQKPEKMLADVAHGVGLNLAGMEERGVDFYTPIASQSPQEGNPAKRPDPQQPVAAEDWPKLPRNEKQKLSKACFVYDPEHDRYYCPMGQPLEFQKFQKAQRVGATVTQRIYRCAGCKGCVLSGECLDSRSKQGRRTVRRDGYEPLREKMAAKMQTPEGQAIYGRRMHTAETPFGHIKGVMGVRQFLLRGLEKVRTEWRWVCTAYNLKKLVAAVARLRAEFAKLAPLTTS
jgi:transposase